MSRGVEVGTQVPAERGTSAALPPRLAGDPFAKLRPGPGKSPSMVADHQRSRIHEALVAIAGTKGFDAVTVRDLARLAGVSTRAFYQHFSSKEDCLLRARALILERLRKRLIAAQASWGDHRGRLRGLLKAFAEELGRDPRSARLILDVAAPSEFEHALRFDQMLAEEIADCLARAPDAVELPSRVVLGVTWGAIGVARLRLLRDSEDRLEGIGDSLARWALPCVDQPLTGFDELDRTFDSGWSDVVRQPDPRGQANSASGSTGDRGLLVAAAARLMASDGPDNITVQRVRASAGVSRRSFDANFGRIEDCVAAAIDRQIDLAIGEGERATAATAPGPERVCRAVAVLCREIDDNPALADLRVGGQGPTPVLRPDHSQDLVRKLSPLLRSTAPGPSASNDLNAEASASAILGILGAEIAAGRTHDDGCPIGGTLTYIALAPAIDSEAAADEILKRAH